jgi:hypothetical protein
MLMVVALACVLSACKSGEICDNGIDDDKNGAADCLDYECSGKSYCLPDGGVFVPGSGPCDHCGRVCAQQANCLAQSYTFDTPLPECFDGICKQLNAAVQIRFEIDTQATWTGVSTPPRSANTRFIRKRAYDGSAVSCATVAAVATGKTGADADQIERHSQFQLSGFDVLPINSSQTATIFGNPFLNAGTGGDFLIWAELWTGPRSTTTRLPTGQRMASACVENGPEVAPLTTDQHCPSPGCRTIRVAMPAPN